MSGVDLNLIGRYSEFFRGVAREYRQDAVRPTHGFSAMEHIHADCCALRRRRWVRTLCCAEQYRAMAFAQLTYRESLRDIETCLSAQASKLYHMGFRERVRRSTLADANETRDWRIYAEFAQRLIAQARKLYADESLGLELTNTVYALDSTTIDLCLSLFPWAHFRSTKAAVTARSARQHPELHPRLGRQAARRSRPRSAAPRSRRHLRHGSRLRRFHAPLRLASSRRLLRHPRQVEPGCPPGLLRAERS